MGLPQQIGIHAARVAHEARRAIGDMTGESGVPSFEALEQSQRDSAIRHTMRMLSGEEPMLDAADDIATIVSDTILKHVAAQAEPAEAPTLHVSIMDDSGKMIPVAQEQKEEIK